jgi:hypothetical protein
MGDIHGLLRAAFGDSLDKCNVVVKSAPCILCGSTENTRLASFFPLWDRMGHAHWFTLCDRHPRTPENEARVSHEVHQRWIDGEDTDRLGAAVANVD